MDHDVSPLTPPAASGGPRPGPVLLLLGLLAILLPAWIVQGAAYWGVDAATDPTSGEPLNLLYWHEIQNGLASPWLPVAMALLVSLRAGIIDLSVWGMSGLAAAVAWLAMSMGAPLSIALLVALAVGVGLGALQGLILARTRIPPVLLTLLSGTLFAMLARLLSGPLEPLSWQRMGWLGGGMGQRFFAALAYGVVMASWVWRGDRRRPGALEQAAPRPLEPGWSLMLSGSLAAWGGVVLLAGQTRYVASPLPVGDLRVLLAVLLCGAATLTGRNARLLSGLLLPVGMLVATMWWLMVWVGPSFLHPDWSGGLVMLLAMVVGLIWLTRRRPAWPAWLACAGILLAAACAYFPLTPTAAVCLWTGTALWLAALAAGAVRRKARA